MLNLLIYFVSIVLGGFAGFLIGGGGPWLLALTYAYLSGDNSDSGMGFFIILTIPCGIIYGIGYGFVAARNLIKSDDGWHYLTHGNGLYFAVPLLVTGIMGIMFSLWLWMPRPH